LRKRGGSVGLTAVGQEWKLSLGVGREQGAAKRVKYSWPTCVHSRLQLIDDGAYPFRVRGIVNPKFVKLPTVLVILKPQK
jgi:hypothetical protein